MLVQIHPKLPMRDKRITYDYYKNQLGFELYGSDVFDEYLMLQKDAIQIHFFQYKELDIHQNYGQVYIRVDNIKEYYESLLINNVPIHPNGSLQVKPWGQIEFSLLDPDNNLLTFGQSV
jgi:hypothetical protein